MNKTYLIFKHEFLHTVKRVSFIIMTLIVPVVVLLGIGITELVTNLSEPQIKEITVVGYVDEVGIFTSQTAQGLIKLVPFASKADATRAMAKRDIAEFIVIPPDYTSSGIIQRFTLEKEFMTPPITIAMIKRFLTGNLLKDKVPPEVAALIVAPLNLEITRLTEEGDIASEQNNIGNIIVPAAFSLLLSLSLMYGASSLVGGLGEEKESRLIELLFSSVSVRQLLIGKILALGIAGLLQVLVWLLSAPLLLSLASSTFGGLMSNIQIPGNFLVLGIIYFILGYLLFAVLSVGIGAISSSTNEGSQLSMFYILLGFAPLWFSSLLFNFPNSPIWVVLTIFPITAPVQTMLRLGVSDIPFWQIIASIGLLGLSVVAGLLLAVKIFRVYMLMYGKRPGIADIFRGLKNS